MPNPNPPLPPDHHVTDHTGCCVEDCPSSEHGDVVTVAIPLGFKPLLDDWLADLGLEAAHFPVPPDHGPRVYAVIVPKASPLLRPHPLLELLRRRPR